jgi:hypothetical protein
MPNPDRKGSSMQSPASFVAAAQLVDRQAAAAAFHAARNATPVSPVAVAPRERLVLRRAAPQDAAALVRLAQLDGAPRPSDAMLVAELDDQIVAAVPFDGGRAIADPFRPTAELVELLRTRTGLLAAAAPARAGRLQRLRPHLRPRLAA